MKVAVPKETAPYERRVALVPEVLGKLTKAGIEIIVESGAGDGSALPDAAYADAGARVVSRDELYTQADVVLRVQKPAADEVARMRGGQALIGLLQPLIDPGTAQALADQGVTAISLDALPRTLSRAQTMDALSSQANVGGYKAVIIAAEAYPRYFPLLTTAAGTAKPANVLVLGIGVAGLQAIATARRLGAQVQAYDVRPETREQAESLGAKFLHLKSVADASGTGGYARELTAEERAAQQQELNAHIGGMDVVITTAQVPGRRPPLLVTAAAVALMKPGSVIVDMAASALGGNVELSVPDQTVVTDNGVTIIAPTNIPATMPAGAATFYARNISALLTHFVKDGVMSYDFNDEITAATVITYRGEVIHAPTAKLLGTAPAAAPAPALPPAEVPAPVASAAPAVASAAPAVASAAPPPPPPVAPPLPAPESAPVAEAEAAEEAADETAQLPADDAEAIAAAEAEGMVPDASDVMPAEGGEVAASADDRTSGGAA